MCMYAHTHTHRVCMQPKRTGHTIIYTKDFTHYFNHSKSIILVIAQMVCIQNGKIPHNSFSRSLKPVWMNKSRERLLSKALALKESKKMPPLAVLSNQKNAYVQLFITSWKFLLYDQYGSWNLSGLLNKTLPKNQLPVLFFWQQP